MNNCSCLVCRMNDRASRILVRAKFAELVKRTWGPYAHQELLKFDSRKDA